MEEKGKKKGRRKKKSLKPPALPPALALFWEVSPSTGSLGVPLAPSDNAEYYTVIYSLLICLPHETGAL